MACACIDAIDKCQKAVTDVGVCERFMPGQPDRLREWRSQLPGPRLQPLQVENANGFVKQIWLVRTKPCRQRVGNYRRNWNEECEQYQPYPSIRLRTVHRCPLLSLCRRSCPSTANPSRWPVQAIGAQQVAACPDVTGGSSRVPAPRSRTSRTSGPRPGTPVRPQAGEALARRPV